MRSVESTLCRSIASFSTLSPKRIACKMDKEKKSERFGKLLAATLLVAGIPTLLIGGFITYQLIVMVINHGINKLISDSIHLVIIFVSITATPIGFASIYYAYILLRKNLVSRSVFYFSISQGLILFYPILLVYISSFLTLEKFVTTEIIIIYSVTILGVILVFQGLYGYFVILHPEDELER